MCLLLRRALYIFTIAQTYTLDHGALVPVINSLQTLRQVASRRVTMLEGTIVNVESL